MSSQANQSKRAASRPAPEALEAAWKVFKAVTASNGDDYAQAVLETYFSTDAALNEILGACGEYGFKTAGLKVVAIVP